MKKRRVLKLEQLEAREVPDISLCQVAPCPVQPLASPNFEAKAVPSPDLPSAGDPQPAVTANTEVAANETEIFDWQELRANLAGSRELVQLLTGSSAALPRLDARHDEEGNNARQSPTSDAALEAWRFLANYTRKAIGNEESKYGSLPDHEDIIHETFVEWRQQVGPEDQAYVRLLNKESPERQVLSKAVRRVIDHSRYEQRRQKRMVELFDQPAPVEAAEQDWIDLRVDWSLGVGNLSRQEKRMLELRRQGKTFAEIGSELGMMKQRVFEMYNSAVDSLQELYCQ